MVNASGADDPSNMQWQTVEEAKGISSEKTRPANWENCQFRNCRSPTRVTQCSGMLRNVTERLEHLVAIRDHKFLLVYLLRCLPLGGLFR